MKIQVVGDAILDHYLYGTITRQSPEDPTIPVVDITNEEYRLGGCLNVAANLKSLSKKEEFEVSVLAPTSKFTNALLMLKHISCPVPTFKNKDVSNPAPEELVKTRIVNSKTKKQLIRLDVNKEYKNKANFYKHKSFTFYDAVVVSDYCKGFVTPELINHLKKYKGMVFVDTKNPNLGLWKNVPQCIVKINSKEFSKASGYESLKNLIITKGPDGADHYENGKLINSFPTETVENAEVTGAGDVFLAGLSISYLRHQSLHSAVVFANICAGLSVRKQGTAEVHLW
jgi:D-beta-D-heptose 7-phosphate kinase/D-beta-D-heptose 1-phosphate adenosyltransferase